MTNKATKAQANYRMADDARHCAGCTMFVQPASCTSVEGEISPEAVCDYYSARRAPLSMAP